MANEEENKELGAKILKYQVDIRQLQRKLKEQLKTGGQFNKWSGKTNFSYSDCFLRKNESWFLRE